MNIVVINHYAGSPIHGMEHRPYHLAREWTRLGHSVTIVAGSYSHLRSHNPEVPDRVTVQELDGIRYVWLRTPTYNGNGLGRVASMAAFVARLYGAGRVVADLSPDVVIASSTYPFDVWPAAALARRFGATFVYEVHDLWPLTPMILGGYSRLHPFILAAQLAEDAGYRRADAVVSLLPGTLPYMQSRGMDPRRFVWIPNGFAPPTTSASQLPQDPHRRVLETLKSRGRFVVGYAGGHGLSNALDVVLRAAEATAAENISYVLMGDGPERSRLVRESEQRGLPNVHFLPRVEPGAVPAFLAAIDVAYLGWHESPLYRFGISPNKLLDYMMAARPIVHAVSAFNDPVRESACGISVPPDDPGAIAAAVVGLSRLEAGERAAMGARGRRYAEANFDYRVLAERFLSFVTGVASARRNTEILN